MTIARYLPVLLVGFPLAASAFSSANPGSRHQGTGLLATLSGSQAPAAASDAVVSKFLNETVEVAKLRAAELPDLYEHFIGKCRDERRQWNYADWDLAATVLNRLNQRYVEVRTELPLEERIRIRTWQGEFHTLKGTRKVADKSK